MNPAGIEPTISTGERPQTYAIDHAATGTGHGDIHFLNITRTSQLRCATSRKVPGSIPGGVNGDFFRCTPDRTMCPEVDSASEREYQGFLLG